MKTILLAWELGAGFGHVGPLVRLAQALASCGHRPVLALRDVVAPRPLLADAPFEVLQAPVWHRPAPPRGRSFAFAGYADILATAGFAREEELAALIAAWDALIGYVRPDLVIADHSPAACLAAFGTLPLVLIGNGFTLPPAHGATFPGLQSERPPALPESRILDTVASVQRRRGRPAPAALPALFAGALRAVVSLPEFDPYRTFRREPLRDPLDPLPAPGPPPDRPRLFAYLGAEHPAIDTIVQALAQLGLPLSIYLRGEAGPLPHFLAARGAEVLDRPPALNSMLEQIPVNCSRTRRGRRSLRIGLG